MEFPYDEGRGFKDCEAYVKKLKANGYVFDRYLRDGGAMYHHKELDLWVKVYVK